MSSVPAAPRGIRNGLPNEGYTYQGTGQEISPRYVGAAIRIQVVRRRAAAARTHDLAARGVVLPPRRTEAPRCGRCGYRLSAPGHLAECERQT